MSSARKGADRGIHLGDQIVADMRAAHVSFEPRQFEFWFAHKSKRSASLSAAVNAIGATSGILTAGDIDRLHALHLSPWRKAEKPEHMVARMGARLEELSVAFEDAIAAARDQRATYTAEADALGAATARPLHQVLGTIDRLIQSTREGQARLAQLEARVETVGREIGTMRQQLAAVREDCTADPTTALPGRAAFDALLAKALAETAETRKPLAVMICGIDYYTAFNENFGNFTADQVLRSIGMLFKAHLRPTDVVARFEGDQFAAILPHLRASEAVAVAERFRQALMKHELIPHPNGAGRVTASLGIADAIKGDTPEFLLRRAQNGLKVAKREGRNRVVEMSPDGPIWEAERRA